jgi:hypothetical protein
MRGEIRFGRADEPDERSAVDQLHRPQAPAALGNPRLLALDERIAL